MAVIFTSFSLEPISLFFSRLVLHSFPNSTCCFAGLKEKKKDLVAPNLSLFFFSFRLILPCIYLLAVVVYWSRIRSREKRKKRERENEKEREREKEHIREDKKVRKVKLILPFKISYSAKLFRYFSFFFAFIVHLLIPYLSLSFLYPARRLNVGRWTAERA